MMDLSNDDIFLEDVKYAASYLKEISRIENKTIGITGATGLIGRMLTYTFAYMNRERGVNIKIVLFVRNINKANLLFRGIENNNIEIVKCDLSRQINYNKKIDFFIHAAADTRSMDMISDPIKVINSIFDFTKNVLELCKNTQVEKLIFLSSMEVYGATTSNDGLISEDFVGRVDINNLRSCYPEAKRLTEILVRSYASKYNMKAVILRPTQTFGAGVSLNDTRVFADFAVSALKYHKIKMNTKGKTVRSYLYLSDLVTAILESIILKMEESSLVFNVSNEEATVSIYEMARVISKVVGNCNIIISEDSLDHGYAPILQMKLSSKRLITNSNWKPTVDFTNMIIRLVNSLKLQLK